ncbi:carbohydrate ABC transporter permease [Paenibacillus humicola]|uniref:carbohydrate ABC transporter permease n=1 Tax=Paenibacillus humicola TaxID=3110540 RepID=UPI00237A5374|nr:sugar ABC transporter permease [Paenibacillus humicola]
MNKKMNIARRDFRNAMLFISLWIIGVIAFKLYPIVISFYYSLTDYSVVKKSEFIGFGNYNALFHDPLFYKSLSNTFYMICLGTVCSTAAAIAIAVLLNNKGIKGLSFLRVVFFIPTLVPVVIASILWIWLLQPDNGIINEVLGFFGLTGPVWLASPLWAKPAFILMMVWSSGTAIIIYLAGLQEIPDSLYESASIDGAGFFRKVFSITLPLLSPVILFNVVTSVIGIFQWFAEPLIMTNGGPDNSTLFYSLNLYRSAFQYFKMGYASAMAWILLVIAMIIILILFRLNKRFGYSE